MYTHSILLLSLCKKKNILLVQLRPQLEDASQNLWSGDGYTLWHFGDGTMEREEREVMGMMRRLVYSLYTTTLYATKKWKVIMFAINISSFK